MKSILFLTVVAFSIVLECHGAPNYNGFACLVEYLKGNGKLDQNYPTPVGYDQNVCPLAVSSTKQALTTAFEKKLTEEDKKSCIIQQFNEAELIDEIMKNEVLDHATHLSEDDQNTQVRAEKDKIIKIFKETADKCQSDPKYGGAFDEEIGSATLSSEEKYCIIKHVIDQKAIDLKNVNVNPDDISTESLDCDATIRDRKTKSQNEYFKAIDSEEKIPLRVKTCMKSLYDSQNIFENEIAEISLELVDLPRESRSTNQEILKQDLAEFQQSAIFCLVF